MSIESVFFLPQPSFYHVNFFDYSSQLFGEQNEDEDVSPDTADPEAGASPGDAALNAEANEEVSTENIENLDRFKLDLICSV